MSAADKPIADILKRYGEEFSACVWRVQGTAVIYHKALERIAVHAKITYDPPTIVRSERDEAVILVTGRMGDRVEWSIGEALIGVNYRVSGKQAAYVWAMAEKRAKDRVILKLAGLHGLLYSEEEADEFRAGRPAASTGDTARSGPRKAAAGDAAGPADGAAPEEVLRQRLDRAKSINAVTDLMLDPGTQQTLAALPDKVRDDLRDHAKVRLVALGWPVKKGAPAGRSREPRDATVAGDGEARDPSSLVKQAGLLADDQDFWRFLSRVHDYRVGDEESCVAAIHEICDVASRKEFQAGTDAAARWVKLVREFRAWEREQTREPV